MTLTRRYRFSASHRLHSAQMSPAQNARLYGKCNNPFGHGHDYILEITVAGEKDPRSGRIVPIPRLDELVNSAVLPVFQHRNINLDVPQFAQLVPTTENIVLVVAELLQQHWPVYFGGIKARLHRIHIQETERNGFDLLLGPAPQITGPEAEHERLAIHA